MNMMSEPAGAILGDALEQGICQQAKSEPHANDRILREIRTKMGVDATLLKYFDLDKVRVKPFEDRKRERPTALPVRIHFGMIKKGRLNPTYVSVILCCSTAKAVPPEQRYNIFTRLGELESASSVDVAVKEATYASAFQCIKEGGSIDKDKLRSVIRYYFIAKNVTIPVMWTIDALFIKELTAACRLARQNYMKQQGFDAARKDLLIAEDAAGGSATYSSQNDSKEEAVDTSGYLTNEWSTVGNPAREASPSYPSKVPQARMVPSPRRSESRTMSLVERLYGPDTSVLQATPHPLASSAPVSPRTTPDFGVLQIDPPLSAPIVNRLHAYSTHTHRAQSVSGAISMRRKHTTISKAPHESLQSHALSRSDYMDVQSSTIASSRSRCLDASNANHPDNHHAPEADFVSSYRTLLDTDDAYTNKLALNKAEQVSLTRKLQDLQDEEEAIKTKKKQGEMEMARLHKSLSDRDRALLTLGMDLQITKNKRGRDCESGQEGGGEDEYE